MPDMKMGVEKQKVSQYVEGIERELSNFLEQQINYWGSIDEGIVPPLHALKEFFDGGGKRLRPIFCYLGYRAAGGSGIDPQIINAGCALEMLHTFALVHDDFMDKADTRRGRPTLHKYLENYYSDLNYQGDIEHLSKSVAILAGDFAFTYADSFVRDLSSECTSLYDTLKVELFAGQQMDLDAVYRENITKDQVSLIAQYKSGKYTIERPIQFGNLLADPNHDIKPWSLYGSPLGEAFQLRDDILGVFGDQSITGKPVGDDIREGKFTLLISEAIESATAEQKLLMEKRGNPNLSDTQIEQIAKVIVETGALDRVEARIKELYEQSLMALEALSIDTDIKEFAEYLARYVCWREL